MLDGEHECSLTIQRKSFESTVAAPAPNGDHTCSASISGEARGHSGAAAAQPSTCSAKTAWTTSKRGQPRRAVPDSDSRGLDAVFNTRIAREYRALRFVFPNEVASGLRFPRFSPRDAMSMCPIVCIGASALISIYFVFKLQGACRVVVK